MSACIPRDKSQQFIISTRPSSRHSFSDIDIKESTRKVPAVSMATIMWLGSGEIPVKYCVVVRSIYGIKALTLQDCDSTTTTASDKRKGSPRPEFLLEKTSSEGPSISPLYGQTLNLQPNLYKQQQSKQIKNSGRKKTLTFT
jgi:hypothetical protein